MYPAHLRFADKRERKFRDLATWRSMMKTHNAPSGNTRAGLSDVALSIVALRLSACVFANSARFSTEAERKRKRQIRFIRLVFP
jgi:hypothetical protein